MKNKGGRPRKNTIKTVNMPSNELETNPKKPMMLAVNKSKPIKTFTRLTESEKLAILKDYYLVGKNILQLAKAHNRSREAVRAVILNDHDPAVLDIKRELKIQQNHIFNKIIAKASKQALKMVSKTSFRDAVVGIGILHDKVNPTQNLNLFDQRQVTVNYPNWDLPATAPEPKWKRGK